MNDLLVASVVLLWLVVLVLAVVVFALARQIGILHERVAPAGALMPATGPRVGESLATITAPNLTGASVTVGGDRARDLMVLFVSPTCPVCRKLVPTAKTLARDEELDLLFASDGDSIGRHRDYASSLAISAADYLLSEGLGRTHQVAKLPFALLIDRRGVLRAKGLVNTREHLESLVEARDLGVASIQEFLENRP